MLAVVVGQRQGRWATELSGKSRPAREARRALEDAGLELEAAAGSNDDDHVVGLAVVVGWHCVTGEARHEQSFALMQASLGHHWRRREHRFFEHRVLAASEICGQLPLPANWEFMPARSG